MIDTSWTTYVGICLFPFYSSIMPYVIFIYDQSALHAIVATSLFPHA